MTMTDPTTLKLSAGKGTPESPCLQSKASLVHAHIHGYLDPYLLDEIFSDQPCWQNGVINYFGMTVNDCIPEGDEEMFARLDRLMPRVVAATVRADDKAEGRINARLVCWLAREAIAELDPAVKEVCERAIVTLERQIDGRATKQEMQDAAEDAYWSLHNSAAASDLADAFMEIAGGAGGFIAGLLGAAIGDPERLIDLFEQLLDQWEKACAEEGAMVDDGWIQALKEVGIAVDVDTDEDGGEGDETAEQGDG